mmetsp:Transcript_128120/g.370908  ORF Transcript_128120/g.370908 Transcript_128120/m.370908 type:complete len:152 (+) Transcript_128120:112-567(+)
MRKSLLLLLQLSLFHSPPAHGFTPKREPGRRRVLEPPTSINAAMKFKNFEQVLEKFNEEPVVIYFSVKKCGPCKLMKKEISTVKKMVGDEFKIFSLDADMWPQVGSRFEISRLPTLVVFQEGEVKLRLEGVNSAESVVEMVRSSVGHGQLS